MKTNWSLWIGFWMGAAVLSIVNIGLVPLKHNQLAYNEYMLGISLIVMIVILVLKRRSGERW